MSASNEIGKGEKRGPLVEPPRTVKAARIETQPGPANIAATSVQALQKRTESETPVELQKLLEKNGGVEKNSLPRFVELLQVQGGDKGWRKPLLRAVANSGQEVKMTLVASGAVSILKDWLTNAFSKTEPASVLEGSSAQLDILRILAMLPIDLPVLRSTMIGKTVAACKNEKSKVVEVATSIVSKWRELLNPAPVCTFRPLDQGPQQKKDLQAKHVAGTLTKALGKAGGPRVTKPSATKNRSLPGARLSADGVGLAGGRNQKPSKAKSVVAPAEEPSSSKVISGNSEEAITQLQRWMAELDIQSEEELKAALAARMQRVVMIEKEQSLRQSALVEEERVLCAEAEHREKQRMLQAGVVNQKNGQKKSGSKSENPVAKLQRLEQETERVRKALQEEENLKKALDAQPMTGTHESNLQLEMVRGKKHLDVAELEVQLRNSAYRTRNFNLSNELKFNVSDLSLEDGCLAIHQRVEIVKGWNGELGHAGNVVLKVTHATSMKHRQGFIQFLTNQLKLSQVQELDESLIQGTLLGNT